MFRGRRVGSSLILLQVRRMCSYFTLSLSTALARVALSGLGAILFLPASAPAQLFHFDTRYQQNDSFGQVPVPIFYAQPEPSPFQQTFSPVYQQHVEFPAAAQMTAEPFFDHGMAAPPMTSPAFPTAVTQPLVQEMQAVPQGYDPAYPIEYPGSSFQGYYPTDGGVIAPPAEYGGESFSSFAPSMPKQAPTVPSVVVEGDGADVVMPEPGAVNVESATEDAEVPTLAKEADADATDAQSSSQTDVEDATKNAKDNAIAEDIKKLKRQMREAELRAKEAEEKSLAIARQATANQKKMDQLKAELAKSRNAMKRMKARATKEKSQLNASQPATAADDKSQDAAATQTSASEAAAAQTNSDSATIELESKASQPIETTKQTADATPAAKAGKRSVVENAPADSSAKVASEDSDKATKTGKSKKQTLREKISALEEARDKQLASAAERIESEFQKKIDAKLDSGKTKKHPEVQLLKESLRERLDDSNGKIRRRYQRQINRMWKEASARSRS